LIGKNSLGFPGGFAKGKVSQMEILGFVWSKAAKGIFPPLPNLREF